MSLSNRVRRTVETAPWVVYEIEKLEEELKERTNSNVIMRQQNAELHLELKAKQEVVDEQLALMIKLRETIDKQRGKLHDAIEGLQEIVEIFAGMNACIPETAVEGYLIHITNKLYEEAKDTLEKTRIA